MSAAEDQLLGGADTPKVQVAGNLMGWSNQGDSNQVLSDGLVQQGQQPQGKDMCVCEQSRRAAIRCQF